MTWLRGLVIAPLLAACGGVGGPSPTYEPGISGAPLDGVLEVVVVDENEREAIAASVEVAHATGTISASGQSPIVLRDDALRGSISIHVRGVDRPQAFVGVTGSRVVIPIARPEVRPIAGSVTGADVLGSDVVVSALVPQGFVRTDALEHAAPVACEPDGLGCRFAIDDAPAGTGAIVATVRDGSGAAVAFGTSTLGSGPAHLDLADPSGRRAVIDVPVAPPPAPPAGLAAVVGVPGLVTPSGVAFLDQTPSAEGTIGVPELTGSIADGSWWLLAEAGPSFADRTRRSVVLQRGLHEPSDVGEWPAWLEPPAISADARTLTPAAGATLHVIDWLAPNGAVVASALVLDPSAPIRFDPGVEAAAIRVRAIDAPGASAGALDLDEAEEAVRRFSESTTAL